LELRSHRPDAESTKDNPQIRFAFNAFVYSLIKKIIEQKESCLAQLLLIPQIVQLLKQRTLYHINNKKNAAGNDHR
jgi:hypothetical protein